MRLPSSPSTALWTFGWLVGLLVGPGVAPPATAQTTEAASAPAAQTPTAGAGAATPAARDSTAGDEGAAAAPARSRTSGTADGPGGPADGSGAHAPAADEPAREPQPGASAARAQGADSKAGAAAVDPAPLLEKARQLQALMAGDLSVEVDAETLLRIDTASLPSEVAQGLSKVVAGDNPRALFEAMLPAPVEPKAKPRRWRRKQAPPGLPPVPAELPPAQALLASYLRLLSLPADERAGLMQAHARRRAEASAAAEAERRARAMGTALEKQRDGLQALLSDKLPLEQDAGALMRFGLLELSPAPLPEGMPDAESLRARRAEVAKLRARLLAMPARERAGLLQAQAERRQLARDSQVAESRQAEAAVASAEQRARDAKEARERALEVAERARTEAQRMVAAERARLLGIREQQANFDGALQAERKELAEGREHVLEWHARVQALGNRSVLDAPRAPDADRMFRPLFEDLKKSREALHRALSTFTRGDSRAPSADVVGDLPANLDTSSLLALRAETAAADKKLRAEERAIGWERVQAMRDDVETLNQARLRLLQWTSSAVRSRIEGYGPDGMAQARAELAQITLELHYQLLLLPRLVDALQRELAQAPMPVLFALFQCLLVLAGYRFWRRVGPRALGSLRRRALTTSPPTPLSLRLASITWYALRIRWPIETLVLLWLLKGIFGEIVGLPGLAYVWLIIAWGLIGSGVVLIVDALAARQQLRIGNDPTARLRIRSLRLVGILVVGAGLILSLFERSVGRGTIYAWVVQACWGVSIPALLLLLHWWRPVVLEHIVARGEQAGGLFGWIRAHQTGWKSYAAAALGGVLLFGTGFARLVLGYASEWEGTRRALAYLFRSEVARQAKARPRRVGQPLDSTRAPSLHPEALRSSIVEEVGQQEYEALVAGVAESRCTLAVVTGERGAGKSVLLRRLSENFGEQAMMLRCPPGGFLEMRAELARSLQAARDVSDGDLVSALRERAPKLVLIDDVHRLVRPAIGGLVELDHLVSMARAAGDEISWVLAIGDPAWAYVARARSERIGFDQVVTLPDWSEDQLGGLLRLVNEHASLSPSFERLVVPRQIDEPAENGDRAELGYYRILWDYSGGNPGVALYWWRKSLYEQDDGQVIVQLFEAPDAWDMETVPLNVRFVLRAILQLELALPRDIADCLELPESSIEEALHFASARGYTEKVGPRYTISWHWYRCIVTALRRQQLITG